MESGAIMASWQSLVYCESPHRCADGRYGLAQHNEQRTDGCCQEPYLDDRFPGTFIDLFTLSSALESFVVSPPISTVMPWILDAICVTTSSQA